MVADALSRRLAVLSLRGIDADWKTQLLVEYSKHNFACEILDGVVSNERYTVMDGTIYYQDWVFLTRNSKLKEKVLQASYDSPLAGHQ